MAVGGRNTNSILFIAPPIEGEALHTN